MTTPHREYLVIRLTREAMCSQHTARKALAECLWIYPQALSLIVAGGMR